MPMAKSFAAINPLITPQRLRSVEALSYVFLTHTHTYIYIEREREWHKNLYLITNDITLNSPLVQLRYIHLIMATT